MIDFEIISAKEAHNQTENNIQFERQRIITYIVENGIKPAIGKGEFRCTVNTDYDIPQDIMDFFKSKGYKVGHVQRCISQRDGFEDNLKSIVLKW